MRRVLVLLLVAGCHDDPTDSNVVTDGDAEALCTKGCSYDVDCLSADLDTCVTSCVDDSAGWVRHDALEAEQNCIAGLGCDEDPGVCGARVKPLAFHHDFQTKCEAQLADCTSLIDCTVDYNPDDPGAGVLRFAAAPIIDELSACLDGADCTARTDCMTSIFDMYGI